VLGAADDGDDPVPMAVSVRSPLAVVLAGAGAVVVVVVVGFSLLVVIVLLSDGDVAVDGSRASWRLSPPHAAVVSADSASAPKKSVERVMFVMDQPASVRYGVRLAPEHRSRQTRARP